MSMCPCHSKNPFADCCHPFIRGAAKPDTAEQLMRSRYTAYTLANVDYLARTHHQQTRTDFNKKKTQEMAPKITWLDLSIIKTTDGLLDDVEGSVEFKAHYKVDKTRYTLHEKSQFVKEKEGWFYVSGTTPQAQRQQKIGRNDPCHCNSGKKYKKCCGI